MTGELKTYQDTATGAFCTLYPDPQTGLEFIHRAQEEPADITAPGSSSPVEGRKYRRLDYVSNAVRCRRGADLLLDTLIDFKTGSTAPDTEEILQGAAFRGAGIQPHSYIRIANQAFIIDNVGQYIEQLHSRAESLQALAEL